jgi:RNA polymerase I-specific transcription initiation factor RRN6
LEFSGTRLTVSDVDEASAKLPELLSYGDSQLVQRLQTIASGHVVGLASSAVTEAPTIASLYDSVLENWIAPLPTNVPVSVRQNKERLARQIAADLILASTRILRPDYTQQQFDTQPGHSQGSEVAISHSASQLPLSDPLFSQPSSLLPNLTQTHTESPSSAVPSVDPLSRLRRHLCIEKPAAKPLPTGISHILSHWQLGTDPSTYSWDASEEALQEEDEDSDDAKQEMKRQSDKRKQERREKRQKRENDLFMAKTFSQPAIPRSSPGPFFSMGVGGAMSSQMPGLSQSQSQSQAVGGMGGLGVQSQVEPGKHGGRPVLKKKKKGKKRVGGF